MHSAHAVKQNKLMSYNIARKFPEILLFPKFFSFVLWRNFLDKNNKRSKKCNESDTKTILFSFSLAIFRTFLSYYEINGGIIKSQKFRKTAQPFM